MHALSIRQPWAWLILHGGKDVENRSWSARYRGPVLIHAGWRWDIEPQEWRAELRGVRVPDPDQIQRGGIVGRVEIVDCVTESDSEWFEGPFGFVLRNPQPLPFFSCRGLPGIFEVSYPSDIKVDA